MHRRHFIQSGALLSSAIILKPSLITASTNIEKEGRGWNIQHPYAITMWDFSWLERRWPGAGYEDWDLILDELVERGYNAVRIDAYPHLVSVAPNKEWTLVPNWNQNDWGSPALNKVTVQPALNAFIKKCADRDIKVGLSTWMRKDVDDTWNKIKTPEDLGKAWKVTLDSIAADGLLQNIIYIDLINEFPLTVWAPFLKEGTLRNSPEGTRWMKDSIAYVRKFYPQLNYTFSMTTEYDTYKTEDVSFLNFLELHAWMTQFSEFYDIVGYHYERFDPKGYENLVQKAEKTYKEKPEYWKSKLVEGIDKLTNWSKLSGKPLATTECWGIVDYKDWPLLNWDWEKELCELGIKTAAAKGRWIMIATSNFCGPQFKGMWRDVKWHQELTHIIKNASIDAELLKQ